MQTSSKFGISRVGKLLLLCLAASALGAFVTSFISKSRREPLFQRNVRYDFSKHMNLDGSGPKAGERLDLQRFAGRNGEQLPAAVSGDVFMLATVDPDCAAAGAARDELHDVRQQLARAHVPYLLVSATNSHPPGDFFKYAESLGVDAPAFLWTSKEVSPPASLLSMVIPSHILVRRDGTILCTWPGTSQSKRVRFRMANQIIADTVELTTNRL